MLVLFPAPHLMSGRSKLVFMSSVLWPLSSQGAVDPWQPRASVSLDPVLQADMSFWKGMGGRCVF